MPAELIRTEPIQFGTSFKSQSKALYMGMNLGQSYQGSAGKSITEYFLSQCLIPSPSMADRSLGQSYGTAGRSITEYYLPTYEVMDRKMGEDLSLLKNFSCCGMQLQDLHALLQHFEECHVKIEDEDDDEDDMSDDDDDTTMSSPNDDLPFELETGIDSMDVDDIGMIPRLSSRPQHITTIVTPASTMGTPSSTTKSQPMPPPEFTTTLSNLTEVILKAHIQQTQLQQQVQQQPAADIIAPSAIYTPDVSRASSPINGRRSDSRLRKAPHGMITPPTSAPITPKLKKGTKRHSSPSYIIQQSSYSISDDMDDDMESDGVSVGAVEGSITCPVVENLRSSCLEGSTSSSHTSHHSSGRPSRKSTPVLDDSERDDRPYKCKVSGCVKSYKNPGGLKYHMQHGHAEDTGDPELNNVIHKPYQCTVPECGKRYKNLNGLKYHIEHAHIELLG